MNELWETLVQLRPILGGLLLVVAWIAWWLWGVNWRKVWPVLAQGAWAPVVLHSVIAALAWSRIAPTDCDCLWIITVPNFLWQLGGVGLLVAAALFCGWLQGVFGWQPAKVELEPAEPAGHGHDHH